MSNNIITPTVEASGPVENLSEELKTKLEEMNNKLSDEKGHWIYVEKHGICWQPEVAGAASPTPPDSVPPLLGEIVQWGKQLDLDNLPQNAVVMIKLGLTDPMRVQMMQRAIARQVLEPRIEILKQKRVCILFMHSDDDITVMTEEEMNQAGWEKKEKSLIIVPGA